MTFFFTSLGLNIFRFERFLNIFSPTNLFVFKKSKKKNQAKKSLVFMRLRGLNNPIFAENTQKPFFVHQCLQMVDLLNA